ncbi:copper resistance CopC family protein [uncultured Nocardioides sp.]|uniref:copper resistance CopC family protein n=1 Tax=uncultured Nocardioides sp. TaxID=198441 RepID=UPI002613907E|nr:copper resistance CopC family protein [uncultured Nocardioides sp.]
MVVGAMLAAGASVTLSGAPAGAHTDFLGSDPQDGAELPDVPSELSLEFSDEMDPQLSTVTIRVDGGRPTPLELTSGADRNRLVAAVPDDLAASDGSTTRWTATFRVVSRDGHPVVGATQFVVRTASPDGTSSPSSSPTSGGDEARAGSNRVSTDAPEPEAAEESGTAATDGREVWPVVALGVGALALLVVGVGAIMRLVGRDQDG